MVDVAAPVASIEEYVRNRRAELDRWFESKVQERSDRHLLMRIFEGGKRLRPILLMLVFDALGGRNRESALDVAFALELAHNASLVHDDILDWDEYRRGKPALWRQLGIGKALIEGHRIINLAFQTVLEKGIEIAKLFLEAWDRSSLGVLEEMFMTSPPARQLYLKIIQEKTATLFSVGAEVAAILAGANSENRRAAREYGMLVGIAYQLADDYVELYRGGGVIKMILRLRQLEEFLRKGYIAMKSGRLIRLLSNAAELRNISTFISEEIEYTLAKIDQKVNNLNISKEYKILLQQYPRFCIKEMLRGTID